MFGVSTNNFLLRSQKMCQGVNITMQSWNQYEMRICVDKCRDTTATFSKEK